MFVFYVLKGMRSPPFLLLNLFSMVGKPFVDESTLYFDEFTMGFLPDLSPNENRMLMYFCTVLHGTLTIQRKANCFSRIERLTILYWFYN